MEKEHSQTFPLMDLPAEIRTMILKELLIMPGPVHFKDLVYPSKSLKKKEKRWRSKFAPFAAMEPVRYHTLTEGPRQWHYIDVKKTTIIKQSSLLNLFLASRAIYSEAMPIYFGCNLFEFDSLDRFKPFISGIGAEKRSQVSVLQFSYSPLEELTLFTTAASSQGDLEHWFWSYGRPNGQAAVPMYCLTRPDPSTQP